ncbi:type II secretion system protein [Campylobacter pinnipediorum]|uniref:type II secretion system protein n=1 Tax=Campylobacter pinnipediorum TaxID=1965231 RepID=UPI000995D0D6|nr:prepilin-type N-terminal cleavage/methylation domain-containing protein [Campylobacter pinnipediorum]
MKKGFTMIELIFVIVILGILAAVAVPRLTATRDDAEVAKAATNVTTLVSDIGAYYTSQAGFADTIGGMTNVQITDETGTMDNGTGRSGFLLAAGKKCIKITLKTAGTDGKPATLKIAPGDGQGSVEDKNGKSEFTPNNTASPICTKIFKNKGVTDIITAKFKYKKDDGTEISSDAGEIAVSGLGIQF